MEVHTVLYVHGDDGAEEVGLFCRRKRLGRVRYVVPVMKTRLGRDAIKRLMMRDSVTLLDEPGPLLEFLNVGQRDESLDLRFAYSCPEREKSVPTAKPRWKEMKMRER